MQEWLEYCNENGIKSDFVFPSTTTNTMRSYTGLRSLLQRFLKAHGLDNEGITLYTFRHTFATILLEEREHPKFVAALMGHKRVSTTLDLYSHVVSNTVYEHTAQTLDNVYAGITGKRNSTSSLKLVESVPSKIDSNFDSNADNFRRA